MIDKNCSSHDSKICETTTHLWNQSRLSRYHLIKRCLLSWRIISGLANWMLLFGFGSQFSFLFGSSPYFVCKFLLQIFVKQNQWEQCWNHYKHVPAPYSDPNYFEISRHHWMRESEIKEGRKKKSIFFVWGFNNERLLTLCSFLLCFLLDDGLISCQSKFNLTVVTRPVRRHFNHPKSSRQHFVD